MKNDDNEDTCLGLLPTISNITIPNDVQELVKLPKIIDKIPIYIEKIKELEKHIDELARKVCDQQSLLFRYDEIKNFMYRAFFIELENRKYDIRCIGADPTEKPSYDFEMRRVRWNEVISSRNVPCEVCGENRSTDSCHIIPRKYGGSGNQSNILILCPTHHRLLDRFMLSKEEYASINWNLKSKISQNYAENVILENHKKFWDRIKNNNNYPVSISEKEGDDWYLYKFGLEELLDIFGYKNFVNKKSILDVVDENMKKITEDLIKYMIDKKFIIQDKKRHFLILINKDFDIDELAKKCYYSSN